MFDLKKQIMWSKLRVGIVITFALLTMFMTVFFAGNLENMFVPKVALEAHLQDVKGLRRGSPVWVSGIEVGSVRDIHLHPEHGTVITIMIKKSALDFIKKDSQASVLTMGLLGDKYVELSAGSPGAEPVKAGDMIKGSAQIDMKEVMEVGTMSVQKMTDFIKRLENLVTEIENGQGTASKLLKDPALYDNLNKASLRLGSVLEKIDKGDRGLVNKDTDKEMKATVAELRELIRDMKENPKKYLKFSLF